jgi:TatD DNase family protein
MPEDIVHGDEFSFADSHVHLASPAFSDDVDAVIARARAAGARALVCIGESTEAARGARALRDRFPELVSFTCGVHPHDAATWDAERDGGAIRQAVEAGAVAIGECGLDYHYDHSPRDVQRRVLEQQLVLSAELARPVVLHTREAEADTIDMLRDAQRAGITGVLHCFTGSHALAEVGLEVGWHISFSGVVTFKKWVDDDLLRMIPEDRLLVESDAPFLAPVPHRGKRNESSFVGLTLARVAMARQVSVAALGRKTLQNTQQLFALPSPTSPSSSPSPDP